MSFHSNIIIFLGIKEQAHSLGVPGFTYTSTTKKRQTLFDTKLVQWNLERASLIGTCWELNCEILQNVVHFGPRLICLGLLYPNLGDGSFRTW